MDYGFSEKRRKGKDKKRDKKKHPYKKGGKFRGTSVEESGPKKSKRT